MLLPEELLTESTLSNMHGNTLQYVRFVYISHFFPFPHDDLTASQCYCCTANALCCSVLSIHVLAVSSFHAVMLLVMNLFICCMRKKSCDVRTRENCQLHETHRQCVRVSNCVYVKFSFYSFHQWE